MQTPEPDETHTYAQRTIAKGSPRELKDIESVSLPVKVKDNPIIPVGNGNGNGNSHNHQEATNEEKKTVAEGRRRKRSTAQVAS